MSRVGQFCRQYYWEQYIGPFFEKIPIFLLVLLLVVIYIFSLLISVTVLLLLFSKIKNIGFFMDNIWYCIGIVYLHALIKKVEIIIKNQVF